MVVLLVILAIIQAQRHNLFFVEKQANFHLSTNESYDMGVLILILIILRRSNFLPNLCGHATSFQFLSRCKPHYDVFTLLIFKQSFGGPFAIDEISERRANNHNDGIWLVLIRLVLPISVFQVFNVVLEPFSHSVAGHGGFDDFNEASGARHVIGSLSRLFKDQLRPDKIGLAQEMVITFWVEVVGLSSVQVVNAAFAGAIGILGAHGDAAVGHKHALIDEPLAPGRLTIALTKLLNGVILMFLEPANAI